MAVRQAWLGGRRPLHCHGSYRRPEHARIPQERLCSRRELHDTAGSSTRAIDPSTVTVRGWGWTRSGLSRVFVAPRSESARTTASALLRLGSARSSNSNVTDSVWLRLI